MDPKWHRANTGRDADTSNDDNLAHKHMHMHTMTP